jgi:phage tail sheath protein FI
MPVPGSHPDSFAEEIPGGRAITGVATSITAFIGRARRGPLDQPVRVHSFTEFEHRFGGLSADSTLSYAVAQFFQNGGIDALIVRVAVSGAAATASVPSLVADRSGPAAAATGMLSLAAASIGDWGNALWARIEPLPGDPTHKLFNLSVRDDATGVSERFENLSTDPAAPRFVTPVLQQDSSLVRVAGAVPERLVPGGVTDADGALPPLLDPKLSRRFTGGDDGQVLTDAAISDPSLQPSQRGIWALDQAALFNLLCIPPLAAGADIGVSTRDAAAIYCQQRRALFIVDPPSGWHNAADAIAGIDGLMTRSPSVALFFPFIRAPDPVRQGQIGAFAPSGAVAGIFARSDAARGVWQSPAGLDATVTGAAGPSLRLTDGDNGRLNPVAINCLRSFPFANTVIWGARTLDGADHLASDWKYIPVRRLALFIEQSVFRGTQWIEVEPHDDATLAVLRSSIGAFMLVLFGQGAFKGHTPSEAFFVRCDRDMTPSADSEFGLVDIAIGFAPMKPAEFVVIRIQRSQAPG